MTPDQLQKWCVAVSTLFGAIGIVLIVFGISMLFASFKVWKMTQGY